MDSDRQLTLRTSETRNLSRRSREREATASGNKASSLPPRRQGRHGASREPRRGLNFAASELEELVKTSEIVPVGDGVDSAAAFAMGGLVHSNIVPHRGGSRMRKNSVDSDTASTMAPTSAEPSPMLAFVVADGKASPAWPSLREASSGWDFCSDVSDDESDLWQDLPEPAMSLGDADFALSAKAPESLEEAITAMPKPSFANVLRSESNDEATHVLPPAPGTLMPAFRARPLLRRSGVAATQHDGEAMDDDEEEEEANDELCFQQYHGWTKQDKASHSTNYQRKVAEKMALRADQRSQNSQSCEGGEPELED